MCHSRFAFSERLHCFLSYCILAPASLTMSNINRSVFCSPLTLLASLCSLPLPPFLSLRSGPRPYLGPPIVASLLVGLTGSMSNSWCTLKFCSFQTIKVRRVFSGRTMLLYLKLNFFSPADFLFRDWAPDDISICSKRSPQLLAAPSQ
jgi:hypothetical protein